MGIPPPTTDSPTTKSSRVDIEDVGEDGNQELKIKCIKVEDLQKVVIEIDLKGSGVVDNMKRFIFDINTFCDELPTVPGIIDNPRYQIKSYEVEDISDSVDEPTVET
ncbi:MAG: hypothetical protein HOE90_06570 [Bacteriovoracaceae bacterium]|nr:hypothetical protein [Bacteriovoracaceae bacterium]